MTWAVDMYQMVKSLVGMNEEPNLNLQNLCYSSVLWCIWNCWGDTVKQIYPSGSLNNQCSWNSELSVQHETLFKNENCGEQYRKASTSAPVFHVCAWASTLVYTCVHVYCTRVHTHRNLGYNLIYVFIYDHLFYWFHHFIFTVLL